ncbi:MAG: hypothetical protein A2Z57_14415 [Planctomycetes bacterium RIFCSPHIGHO2_12_39_6]|nr:MAG: hypothetical protein A2Z57_14415 [Planctomycetes bacterium RIFCSPHIGHO2_12_39_6]
MGMPPLQAKSIIHNLYKQAEDEARNEGSINLPMNMGDILLEKESIDEGIKSMLAKRRKEGVRDEDIRWWMNRHELDRKMMARINDMFKFAMFLKLTKADGLSDDDDAAIEVKKSFTIFGDPDDTSTSIGDDKPLPSELKYRIDTYIWKRSVSDPEKFKEDMRKSTSFNALIRQELRKGNI